MKEQYSFSRLTTWEDCKAAYHLTYNEKKPRQDSFFGKLGNVCHDIMEKRDNGEEFDVLQFFQEGFVESSKYPAHMEKQTSGFIQNAYYKKLYAFFEKIPKLSSPSYKAEQEILIPIGDFKLKGFIDSVRDEGRTLLDYKTNNPDGAFWNHEKKVRQLYLYAGWVKKKFGYFPDKLVFWFIRYNKWKIEKFDIAKFNATIKWAKQMVQEIREHEGAYTSKSVEEMEGLFCSVICGVRDSCTMRLNLDKLKRIQNGKEKKEM